ncbi:MAG: Kazal-type serine protease inhibitor family protein, partial [Polyangiales bacterium]
RPFGGGRALSPGDWEDDMAKRVRWVWAAVLLGGLLHGCSKANDTSAAGTGGSAAGGALAGSGAGTSVGGTSAGAAASGGTAASGPVGNHTGSGGATGTGGASSGSGGAASGAGGRPANGGSGGTSANGGAGGAQSGSGGSASGTGGASTGTGGTGGSGTGTGGTASSGACGSRGLAPCPKDEFCNYPLSAMCGATDAPGTCMSQPQICTDIYAPVCGCDSKTYASDCTANSMGVSVKHTGPC